LFIVLIFLYYIFKLTKTEISNYSTINTNYNYSSQAILKKYGNYNIKNIYLVSEPASKMTRHLLKLVSTLFNSIYRSEELDKSLINSMTHLSLIIDIKLPNNNTKLLRLEKNNCIILSEKINLFSETRTRKIVLSKNKYTINEILDKTKIRIGSKDFFNWHITKNNCMHFVYEILFTINKLTKNNKKIIFENNKLINLLSKTKNFKYGLILFFSDKFQFITNCIESVFDINLISN